MILSATGLLNDYLGRIIAFIALYMALFVVAKGIKSLLSPYNLSYELVKTDNLAISLCVCGYYLGLTAIFMGALTGPSEGLLMDVFMVGSYSLLGILFLNVATWVNDKAILRTFCDTKELVQERNIGVGAVHFGASVATGLIAGAAVSGQGGGYLSAVVFFVLGQLSLCLFSFIYEKLSPYDIHQCLQQKNIASGVAFGGNLIALGIVVANGTSGDFTNWTQDLLSFAGTNLLAFLFLPLIRWIMNRSVVWGTSLSTEIRDDKNIGAGLLEAIVAISFASLLTRLI